MKKLGRISALVLSLMLVLSACGGSSTSNPSGTAASSGASSQRALKDTFTLAVSTTVNKLDCGDQGLMVGHQVARALYDTLIFPVDKDGKYAPCLAKSWEQKDDKTLIFKLRDDVYFHNGEKMTAEDVAFSIQRCTKLINNKTLFKAFDAANTKAIDATTVQVKFLYPFASALNYLSTSRGGIVSKKAVETMGDDAFGQAPIGTGPFKFVKWVQGDRIVLESFDKYWGTKPTYKNLIFRFITETSVRAMELEAGGVDAIFSVGPQDYARLSANKNLVTYANVGYTHENLQINMKCDEFKDIRIRKALALSLDTAAIVKAVYGDLGTPANGLFSDQIFGQVKLGPIKRDVAAAKQLLVEAGYPNGLKTEITVPEAQTTHDMLEIAQAQWKEAGIDVKITTFDQATMKERSAAGQTLFGRSNLTVQTGDPDNAMGNWNTTYGGVMQPNDKHIDELMEKGLGEFDATKRAAIYKELQEYCWNTYYSIPLVFPKVTFAHSKNVEGYVFTPADTPYFNTVKVYAK